MANAPFTTSESLWDIAKRISFRAFQPSLNPNRPVSTQTSIKFLKLHFNVSPFSVSSHICLRLYATQNSYLHHSRILTPLEELSLKMRRNQTGIIFGFGFDFDFESLQGMAENSVTWNAPGSAQTQFMHTCQMLSGARHHVGWAHLHANRIIDLTSCSPQPG